MATCPPLVIRQTGSILPLEKQGNKVGEMVTVSLNAPAPHGNPSPPTKVTVQPTADPTDDPIAAPQIRFKSLQL
jgi:hypothetical protein